MKYKSILILLFYLTAVYYKANAEPAFPGPMNMLQPDGSSLTVLLKGDEFFAYNTTIDGYPPLARVCNPSKVGQASCPKHRQF
ncbi:MAG: hypothetical protein Q4G63_12950 [Bacteroidia bacterium]|nr:hypothetical protein [Bacteroidia bacterium]